MGFFPFAPASPGLLSEVADTSAGFALVNGTPNILTWTAPNDGSNHRFVLLGDVDVAVTETGGAVSIIYTLPDGTVDSSTWQAGAQAPGVAHPNFRSAVVQAGSTVTLKQNTALTAGAATVFAEIWAA